MGSNLTDEQAVLKGGSKTDDETVRSGAVGLFESYRGTARPVELAAIKA